MTRLWIKLVSLLSLACACLVLVFVALGQQIRLPDNELVFADYQAGGNTMIYRMDIAYGLIHPVTAANEASSSPVWSPDGQHIAYANKHNNQSTIDIVNVEGKAHHRVITTTRYDYDPVWSPNGHSITFIGNPEITNPEIYRMNVETEVITRLTINQFYENTPTWSPDGQQIIFSSDITTRGNMDLFSVDVETEKIQPIIATQEDETNPAWSPDGRYLIYRMGGILNTLVIYDTQTNQSIPFNSALFYGLDTPDWSSDGHFVVYSGIVNTLNGIYRLDVQTCLQQPKTCTPELLTPKLGHYLSPHWRPNST